MKHEIRLRRRETVNRYKLRWLFSPFRPSRLIPINMRRGYSQTGEDLIFKQLIGNSKSGFYIDIGCGHPIDGSNTYLLHRLGWRGLAIDANPKFSLLWKFNRPRDRFVNCAIKAEDQADSTRSFYNFYADVYSTFDYEQALNLIAQGLELKSVDKIPMKELGDLVRSFSADFKVGKIQLLSIDVEGLELEVLRLYPFELLNPEFVCIEELRSPIIQTSAVREYLAKQGFSLIAYTGLSSIYGQTKDFLIDRA